MYGVEARPDSQYENCCKLGTSLADKGLGCKNFTGPVFGVPSIEQDCSPEAIENCCVQAYQEKSCEKGRENARAGLPCAQGENPENLPSEQQWICCEACKLGKS